MPTITLEQRLLNARNAYAYPLVYIERLVLDGNGKYLPVAAPGPLQLLDDWEVLHSTRLRSTDPEQALLGVVSIVSPTAVMEPPMFGVLEPATGG